jgi:release factor glutamine methyltransferase
MNTSIAEALLQGTNELRVSGVPEARREAGSLLGYVLKRDRSFLLTHADDSISESDHERFNEIIDRRANGEPLQYITGHQEFFGLDFEVNRDVLIPRPETELLIETALRLFADRRANLAICDVGTGSGCIAITLLDQFKQSRAVAVDISPAALEVAERNALRCSVADRIAFVVSDCFAALSDRVFDLIVSNPPYVEERALSGLQREVREWEPYSSLVAGSDGLTIIRRLLADAPQFLKAGGYFLFEIGFNQHEAVAQLIDPAIWKLLDVHLDLQGIPRIVALHKL